MMFQQASCGLQILQAILTVSRSQLLLYLLLAAVSFFFLHQMITCQAHILMPVAVDFVWYNSDRISYLTPVELHINREISIVLGNGRSDDILIKLAQHCILQGSFYFSTWSFLWTSQTKTSNKKNHISGKQFNTFHGTVHSNNILISTRDVFRKSYWNHIPISTRVTRDVFQKIIIASPSSHNHGSGKWVPPILVSLHLAWFSTSMIMGERVETHPPPKARSCSQILETSRVFWPTLDGSIPSS